MKRQTIFCKHYRAMSEHKTCSAGVEYESLKGVPWDDRPCFVLDGKVNPTCNLAAYPTPEEIEAEDAELRVRFEKIGKARQAIVDHLGGPWKKGKPGAQGVIDCPACNGAKTLQFSRAGYNGHIHARCTSKDCVSWME